MDDIPWAELEHAYGSAADVPGQLRDLTVADAKVRRHALHALYGNVFHQGTRYPATPYVVPFLIELCGARATYDRGGLLRFWGSLITGYFSVQERPCWGDGQRLHWAGSVANDERDDPYAAALHEIYRRSLAGHTLLCDLLADGDSTTRASAAFVLACLPTAAGTSRQVMRARLEVEASGWVRAAMAFALGELGGATELARILDADASPVARCMAACQLARLTPTSSLLEPLLRFVTDPIEGYETVPGAAGKSTGDSAHAIGNLPIEVRRQAVPALCDRLEQCRSFDTMPLVRTLLAASFQPQQAPVTALSELQRSILVRMVNTQELWSIGNLFWTFKVYGLPQDRRQCAKLAGVAVTEAADDPAAKELRSGLAFAQLGFLDKGRYGIERAVRLDPAVIDRSPDPGACWLLCAKAFAPVDAERAVKAYRNACAINPALARAVGVEWELADVLRHRELGN